MSDFGTATLNREKAAILPLFRKPVPKLTEFWNWLTYKISLADSLVLAEAKINNASIITADHHEFNIIEKSENINFFWIR